MKVRNGFVSNSSSSSFLIYGTGGSRGDVVVSDKLIEVLKSNERFCKYRKDVEITKEWLQKELDDGSIDMYDLCEAVGLESHNPYDSCYVGVSWDEVGDDETGRQFKERVKEKLKLLFGDGVSCETLQEAWHD